MEKKKIYVASSWRNDFQPAVVELLRSHGHTVYDFKNPPNQSGFAWSEIDPNWQQWTPKQFANVFDHPRVVSGFQSDYAHLFNCDMCLLVLPCGRSAHLEAGYAAGMNKATYAFIPEGITIEPELMYGMFNQIFTNTIELNKFFTVKPVNAL